MPDAQAPFPHLPIPVSLKGTARSAQGRTRPSRTDVNKQNQVQHSQSLVGAALSVVKDFNNRKATNPVLSANLPSGIPLLLQIDPDADLDFLRGAFGFELVSEDEDGFVIVTSKDFDLSAFIAKIQAFGRGEHGSGQTAKVYQLFSDATRLQHILSPELLERWPRLDSQGDYTVDVSVSFGNDFKFPDPIKQDQDESDEHFAQRTENYEQRKNAYYTGCEKLQIDREDRLERIVRDYEGQILQQT